MTDRPTLEEIAEFNARAATQFACDLAKLIHASEIEPPQLVAIVLCQVLVQLIMVTGEMTFAEAGKTAVRVLKDVTKCTKYGVSPTGELIDIKTGEEISPGGFKQ